LLFNQPAKKKFIRPQGIVLFQGMVIKEILEYQHLKPSLFFLKKNKESRETSNNKRECFAMWRSENVWQGLRKHKYASAYDPVKYCHAIVSPHSLSSAFSFPFYQIFPFRVY